MPYQEARQYPIKGPIVDVTVPAVCVGAEWQGRFADTIVDLLKIDVEGKELDFIVYEGAFIQRRVRRLVVEWHKLWVALGDLNARLESIGFVQRGIYNETELLGVAVYDNASRVLPNPN
jgi:hypothetical protein